MIAYDSDRNVTVLYGGIGGGAQFLDTWEWDGTSGSWTDRTPASAPSPDQFPHSMTYDSARQRVVLVTGPGDQIWEWDGLTGEWTERRSRSSDPSPTGFYGEIAYDSVRE